MKNFRCMNCGAEYEELPFEGCSAPGCGNDNLTRFEVIDNSTPEPAAGSASSPRPVSEPAPAVHTDPVHVNDTAPDPDLAYVRVNSVTPETSYRNAMMLYEQGTVDSLYEARQIFISIIGYKNSEDMILECEDRIDDSAKPKKKKSPMTIPAVLIALLILVSGVVLVVMAFSNPSSNSVIDPTEPPVVTDSPTASVTTPTQAPTELFFGDATVDEYYQVFTD